MYKLLIDRTNWKDCSPNSSEEDVLFIANRLSKFSRCRVDVYEGKKVIYLTSFNNGHLCIEGEAV